jgi:hypothetical protein
MQSIQKYPVYSEYAEYAEYPVYAEYLNKFIDNEDQPTVQNVIAAHMDTDEVNVQTVFGETQHDVPSAKASL